MNTLAILAALRPFIEIGSNGLISWLVTLLVVVILIACIVWGATRIFGPPSFPEPVKWILWLIVALVCLALILGAFGFAM